jgi:hypothetical protein
LEKSVDDYKSILLTDLITRLWYVRQYLDSCYAYSDLT